MNRFRCKEPNGFTLIELMVVVGTVMVLLSIVSTATIYTREKAKTSVFYSDLRLIKIAAERFQMDVGFFPPDVWRGIDPGLVDKYGWQEGNHSPLWEDLDLSGWKGPYLDEWKSNPWGGLYDWDNYYDYMEVDGGGAFLCLRPINWGGTGGLPTTQIEALLEAEGTDLSDQKNSIVTLIGTFD